MRASVRWRLALWNTLSFGVLLAAFAGLVYALAHREAFGAVDRKLAGCLDQFARDERIRRITASVLRENGPMYKVFRRLGFQFKHIPGDETTEAEFTF